MRKGIPKGVSWAQPVPCHRSQSAYRLPRAITRLAAITEYLLAREISFWYPPGLSSSSDAFLRAEVARPRSYTLEFAAISRCRLKYWRITGGFVATSVQRNEKGKNHPATDHIGIIQNSRSTNRIYRLLSAPLAVPDDFPKRSLFHKRNEGNSVKASVPSFNAA